MKVPKVYVLINRKYNKTYTGSTDDIEKRLREHNAGYCEYTKRFLPWELLHSEQCSSLREARKREKYYKSCAGRKKLEKLFLPG